MGGSSEAQAVINAKTSKHVGEQSQQAVMLHIVLDLLVHVRHTCCYTVRSSPSGGKLTCTSEEKVTCTSGGDTHEYKRVVVQCYNAWECIGMHPLLLHLRKHAKYYRVISIQ